VKAVKSILVVVDRGPAAAEALTKAVLLARKLGARIELFLCDAERGYALSQAYVPTGVEEARRACVEGAELYLDVLKQSAVADDIQITFEARCESPLYESIVKKVLRQCPDLVIKSAAGIHGQKPVRFDATDWQLMRTCPANLMLTRGRPWQARPRFAAAIDASGAETEGLAGDILNAAQLVTKCSGGELDVIYAEPADVPNEMRASGARNLHDLCQKFPETQPLAYVLAGTAEISLPEFARKHDYDAVFLGALTHRPNPTSQVGTLTSKLVEALDCDFILVKPGAYRSPIGMCLQQGTALEAGASR
jgi:universal stress protein E